MTIRSFLTPLTVALAFVGALGLASCVPTGDCTEEKGGIFSNTCIKLGDDSGDSGDSGAAPIDGDGDGFDSDVDCDDENAAINPDVVETCNDVDDNCDGDIDETGSTGESLWYADADGDGRGDADSFVSACDQPAGYVPDGVDCDDGEATVYPGADELCDGLDNDCDEDIDDGLEFVDYYTDDDGDGYGAGAATSECENPGAGYSTSNDDCEDTEYAVHPNAIEDCTTEEDLNCDGYGATSDNDGDGTIACEDCDDGEASAFPGNPEVCDEIDNDCNTVVDDDASDAETFFADSDGDGYGDPDSTVDACDAPFGYVADDTDCNDAASTAYPGAAEVCDGSDIDENCDGIAEAGDSAGATSWHEDSDGDGYGSADVVEESCDASSPDYIITASGDEDCDDGDPAVNVGATESCNGVDDNCDGDVDESGATGETTWYADSDGDGYGDFSSTKLGCTQPTGYVGDDTDCDDSDSGINPGTSEIVSDGIDQDCDGADSTEPDSDGDGYGESVDCDDGDSGINPGAVEVCDGIDNDCSGSADDGSVVFSDWYADSDSDGYGDPAVGESTCDGAPSGYVGDNTDCDDGDSGINPGETEACDGLDNDCDGDVDESGSVGETTWYADADGDGFGDAVLSTTSCVMPSGYVASSDDCDDADGGINPDASEICDSVDNDCDGDIDESTTMCVDGDGDGCGDSSRSTDELSCSEVSTYVGYGYEQDCSDPDDTDAGDCVP